MDDFNDFGEKENNSQLDDVQNENQNLNASKDGQELESEPQGELSEDDFVDLSAYYNTKDIGILADDDSDEETLAQGDKKKRKNKNPWITRGIAIFLGVIILAGAAFLIFRDKNTYYELCKTGDKISNGDIEVTIEAANVVDSLLTYQLDEDYVYVAVMYTFKNVSKETLTWECTPYMSLKPYTQTDKGYLPLTAEEEASLLDTLKNLKDNKDNTETSKDDSKENQTTQDIPSSVTVSDDGTVTSQTDDSNTSDVLTGDAYTSEVKSATEASGNESITGVFDFNALQIFALDAGLDFSTAKEDLKPGESRQSADVFKIRKELFDNKKYFIGADNLPGIIEVSLTPLDIDSKTTETTQQTQDQTLNDGASE